MRKMLFPLLIICIFIMLSLTVNATDGLNFTSTWDTTKTSAGSSSSTQITLPLEFGGTYDFIVEWGDDSSSTITSWDDADKTHTYSASGKYVLNINGTIQGFRFNNAGDKNKLLNISSWGNLSLGNNGSYFYGCENFVKINATDTLNLSGTYNLSRAFEAELTTDAFGQIIGTGIFDGNVSSWNVSQVTDMSRMFYGQIEFNESLIDWETYNVTDMSEMFYLGQDFNGNISTWNTSSVTDMGAMFYGTSDFGPTIRVSLNQSLENWDTSSVTNMSSMFYRQKYFNSNLSLWNTSQVTDMSEMFYYNYQFNQNLSDWDTSSVTDMGAMFALALTFKGNITNWNTSQVTDMNNMFAIASQFNQNLTDWDTSKVTNMSGMFSDIIASSFNGNISTWNTSSVTDMSDMFYGAAAFNQSLADWNTSSVTTMENMFREASNFDQDISVWDISSVTTMDGMFTSATDFSTANYNKLLNNWSTQEVQNNVVLDIDYKQYDYSAYLARNILVNTYGWTITDSGLTDTELFISNWDTTQTSTGSSTSTQITLPLESDGSYYFTAFWGDGSSSLISSWDDTDKTHTYSSSGDYEIKIGGTIDGFRFNNTGDRSKLMNITRWGNLSLGNNGAYFYGCSNFANISTTDTLNLSSTTNLSYTFADAPLFNGNISNWNTTLVTDMSAMFFNDDFTSSFNANLSTWNTSSVKNMQSMFLGASSFDQNLSTWETYNVTDMSGMFSRTNFNNDISTWNTSSVTDMNNMFFSALFNQDISAWDVSSVTNTKEMFRQSSFNQPIPDWDTSSLTDMEDMFRQSASFNQNISNWNTTAVTNMYGTFRDAAKFSQNLSDWNTSQVTNMGYLFNGALKFSGNISNWDTSSVINMTYMMSSLREFNFSTYSITSWNTSSVQDMSYMFKDTKMIVDDGRGGSDYVADFNQDISVWDVSSVTTMDQMFYDITSYTIDLSAWNVSSVLSMVDMFSGVTLPTGNYSFMLINWSQQEVQTGVTFSAGNSIYNYSAYSSRNSLIDDYSWTITDGGIEPYINLTNTTIQFGFPYKSGSSYTYPQSNFSAFILSTENSTVTFNLTIIDPSGDYNYNKKTMVFGGPAFTYNDTINFQFDEFGLWNYTMNFTTPSGLSVYYNNYTYVHGIYELNSSSRTQTFGENMTLITNTTFGLDNVTLVLRNSSDIEQVFINVTTITLDDSGYWNSSIGVNLSAGDYTYEVTGVENRTGQTVFDDFNFTVTDTVSIFPVDVVSFASDPFNENHTFNMSMYTNSYHPFIFDFACSMDNWSHINATPLVDSKTINLPLFNSSDRYQNEIQINVTEDIQEGQYNGTCNITRRQDGKLYQFNISVGIDPPAGIIEMRNTDNVTCTGTSCNMDTAVLFTESGSRDWIIANTGEHTLSECTISAVGETLDPIQSAISFTRNNFDLAPNEEKDIGVRIGTILAGVYTGDIEVSCIATAGGFKDSLSSRPDNVPHIQSFIVLSAIPTSTIGGGAPATPSECYTDEICVERFGTQYVCISNSCVLDPSRLVGTFEACNYNGICETDLGESWFNCRCDFAIGCGDFAEESGDCKFALSNLFGTDPSKPGASRILIWLTLIALVLAIILYFTSTKKNQINVRRRR